MATYTGTSGADVFSITARGNHTIGGALAGDRIRIGSARLLGIMRAGNGATVLRNQVQWQAGSNVSYLRIGLDGLLGKDINLAVTGKFTRDNFLFDQWTGDIRIVTPRRLTNTRTSNTTYTATAAMLNGVTVISDSGGSADLINIDALFTENMLMPTALRDGNDLVLQFAKADGSGRLVIRNHFTTGTVEWIGAVGGEEGMRLSKSLSGTSANEFLVGTARDERILARAGEDEIWGGGGSDIFVGDADDILHFDDLTGGGVFIDLDDGTGWGPGEAEYTITGIREVCGTHFADTLIAAEGSNSSAWNSILAGNGGADVIIGNTMGTTIAAYEDDPAGIVANLGAAAVSLPNSITLRSGQVRDGWGKRDRLVNVRMVEGSRFNDVFYLGGVDATADGGAGQDKFVGGNGTDAVSFWDDAEGSAGFVVVNLSQNTETVSVGGNSVSVGGRRARDGWGNVEVLTSIEVVSGSEGNDFIFGGTENNWLSGGEAGVDRLTGGGGADTFYWVGFEGTDVVEDFGGDDSVQLSRSMMGLGSLTLGTLSDANFLSADGATFGDSNDYLVFNSSSNTLYYDPTPGLAGGQVAIATFNQNVARTQITIAV